MAVRPIRLLGDPVLTNPTAQVTKFDQHTKRLIDDLLDTVKLPGRAGVAATQIGVGKAAFSYNVEGCIGYVLNPELVDLSCETQDDEEGCLSVPNLYYPCVRAVRAVVRGVDINNDPVTVRGEGLMARALQHETDHCNGMLYLTRLEKAYRKAAMREARHADWFVNRGVTGPAGTI